GDARRAAELSHRAARVEAEIGDEERRLADAGALQREAARVHRGGGAAFAGSLADERANFLDAQAALPASRDVRARRLLGGRDYGALTALAGYTRAEYERLDPAPQRAA